MKDEGAMDITGNADDSAANLADLRTGPGIVVLSVTMQLLYMNQVAHDLTRQIHAAGQTKGPSSAAHGVLPTALTELCRAVIDALKEKTEAKDWEQFHVTRIAASADGAILLRGFGLPDSGGLSRARIVVTIEPLGRQEQQKIEQAQERYQLTDREMAVLRELVKGFTNKEIANTLTITEQTVKEHVKHIMRKTGATTRAGIVAKVLGR
jgi:DNA-binding NarL/FixJ family response regulator